MLADVLAMASIVIHGTCVVLAALHRIEGRQLMCTTRSAPTTCPGSRTTWSPGKAALSRWKCCQAPESALCNTSAALPTARSGKGSTNNGALSGSGVFLQICNGRYHCTGCLRRNRASALPCRCACMTIVKEILFRRLSMGRWLTCSPCLLGAGGHRQGWGAGLPNGTLLLRRPGVLPDHQGAAIHGL